MLPILNTVQPKATNHTSLHFPLRSLPAVAELDVCFHTLLSITGLTHVPYSDCPTKVASSFLLHLGPWTGNSEFLIKMSIVPFAFGNTACYGGWGTTYATAYPAYSYVAPAYSYSTYAPLATYSTIAPVGVYSSGFSRRDLRHLRKAGVYPAYSW